MERAGADNTPARLQIVGFRGAEVPGFWFADPGTEEPEPRHPGTPEPKNPNPAPRNPGTEEPEPGTPAPGTEEPEPGTPEPRNLQSTISLCCLLPWPVISIVMALPARASSR